MKRVYNLLTGNEYRDFIREEAFDKENPEHYEIVKEAADARTRPLWKPTRGERINVNVIRQEDRTKKSKIITMQRQIEVEKEENEVAQALTELGIQEWVLRGEPTTKDEFTTMYAKAMAFSPCALKVRFFTTRCAKAATFSA